MEKTQPLLCKNIHSFSVYAKSLGSAETQQEKQIIVIECSKCCHTTGVCVPCSTLGAAMELQEDRFFLNDSFDCKESGESSGEEIFED